MCYKKIARILVLLIILFQGLILLNHDRQIREITNHTVALSLTRDAFVQIEVALDDGSNNPLQFKGSGVLIGKHEKNNYILTANHLCNPAIPDFLAAYAGSKVIYVIDFGGETYFGNIVLNSLTHDLCLLQFEGDISAIAVRVANYPPHLDEKVYAYAAPTGFFAPHVIPLFEGRYAGDITDYGEASSAYTMPAVGGSSGAAILNNDGEIVGVVHSSLVEFHHIVLATRHEDMTMFLNEYYVLSGINFLQP